MFHDFQTASILRISHKYAYHGIDCRIDYGSHKQEDADDKEEKAEHKEAHALFLRRLPLEGRVGIPVLLIGKTAFPFFAGMGAVGTMASVTVLIGAVPKAVMYSLMLLLRRLLPVEAATFGTAGQTRRVLSARLTVISLA